ncbi:MAG: LysM peptidoglycan-binding domain-containing protein [Burkholderiales bacterium]|nr:LysM peptidoglycan-binding domain-containing protein [Anaerolineae bacterium]
MSLIITGAALAQDATSDLLGRVNGLRGGQGLYPYNLNGALSAAAQQQAQWIADTGSVSHTHPDGSGPRTRAVAAGYPTTDVSENIYGGTMASADTAWIFWINSGIHYNALVSGRYSDVGVGVATTSWGTAFVMVFGNPGGPPPAPPPSAGGGSASTGDTSSAAPAPEPPSYILGLDERGNIMHEVQPGDTLGEIALIYGYTWAELPYMMELNGIGDVRDLEVGSVFLVPPHDGTFTPTPGGPAENVTPESDNDDREDAGILPTNGGDSDDDDDSESREPTTTPLSAVTPTFTETRATSPSQTPTAAALHIATSADIPEFLIATEIAPQAALPVSPIAIVGQDGDGAVLQAFPTDDASLHQSVSSSDATEVAILLTPAVVSNTALAEGGTITRSTSTSPWLVVALVVQVGILLGAVVEFFRRRRR